MGLQQTVYNVFFKRTSTFVISIVAFSVFFERAFDVGADKLFDNINKGRQWKDIKHKYETKEE